MNTLSVWYYLAMAFFLGTCAYHIKKRTSLSCLIMLATFGVYVLMFAVLIVIGFLKQP